MKAIVMKEFGGPEVLKYVDVPDPVPEANEVLIKLAFCGVNPNETYVRTGTYNFYKPELPYTPGYDGAGVIEKVGAGVTHVKVGDRVFVAALLANAILVPMRRKSFAMLIRSTSCRISFPLKKAHPLVFRQWLHTALCSIVLTSRPAKL